MLMSLARLKIFSRFQGNEFLELQEFKSLPILSTFDHVSGSRPTSSGALNVGWTFAAMQDDTRRSPGRWWEGAEPRMRCDTNCSVLQVNLRWCACACLCQQCHCVKLKSTAQFLNAICRRSAALCEQTIHVNAWSTTIQPQLQIIFYTGNTVLQNLVGALRRCLTFMGRGSGVEERQHVSALRPLTL